MLMSNVVAEYLTQVDHPVTRGWYERRLRPLLDLPDHDEVTPAHIRERWERIITRPISATTKNQYRRAWRTLWAWMRREGITERESPVRVRPVAVGDRAPRHITEDEIYRLLDAAHRLRDRVIIMLLADTGMRLGGLVGLRWQDVDIERRTLTVVEKGNRERTVYMSRLTAAVLSAYRDEAGHTTPRGSNIWALSYWGIKTMLRRLGAEVGVRRSNPHAFRHGYARSLVSRRVDVSLVSRLMGHSDPALTIKFYARWYDEDIRAAHARGSMFAESDPLS